MSFFFTGAAVCTPGCKYIRSHQQCDDVWVSVWLALYRHAEYDQPGRYVSLLISDLKRLGTYSKNKPVIDRRLRPRCCHLGSYFKRPKSSTVRPLARNWYYCAQFIAKSKASCALRFSWAATSSNLGLWANMTSSIKQEVHNTPPEEDEPRP